MRHIRHTFILAISMGLLLPVSVQGAFNHPGLLHGRADLERMKNMVSREIEPVKSGFEVFKADPASQLDYRMRGPGEEIGRNPGINAREFDSDANAAYQLSLMWIITGEKAYADKAIEIINAWSGSLKRVSGRDAVLMGGLGPFKMINAAEILRYTDTGWLEADIQQCEQMFLEAIYPAVKDFALFANGNWDAAAIQTVMAIGVFCNDQAIFERGLRYYINGAGDGSLLHYVINEFGQCQESGRDQQHTQLGLALLAASCEVAWQQGLDLYSYADYRLLKGFEYTAKYNLGEDVPFVETLDRTGKYHHKQISTEGRGQLRAVFEMVYNHYVNRAGMETPWIQKAARQVRPEGAGRPGADHPGFGTLLFSRPKAGRKIQNTAPPAGLIAKGDTDQIDLTWVASIGAEQYSVKRAESLEGPYEMIAKNINTSAYVDTDIQTGKVYYYTVSAISATSVSDDAYPVGACAGLPNDWKQADIGSVQVDGSAGYDGQIFTIQTGSATIDSVVDQFHFIYIPMSGDGIITACYVPQVSSQFTCLGLMMRQSLDPDAAHASMLITPRFDRDIEAPGWYARLMTRTSDGADTLIKDGSRLEVPYTSYGRLTGCCWLRLTRVGNVFSASVSPDGQTWTEIGQSTVVLKENLLVGLAACSGLKTIATTVKFNNVKVVPDSRGD